MMRHRSDPQQFKGKNNHNSESSSEDDADVFSSLSRKRKADIEVADDDTAASYLNQRTLLHGKGREMIHANVDASNLAKPMPPVTTSIAGLTQKSSAKRHHGDVSDAHKAKLDAILMELEAGTKNITKSSASDNYRQRGSEHDRRANMQSSFNNNNRSGGSYVDPGDKHITTNIFVGNLAPSITEEQMTELFQQFGDLYSVKIMWPRSPEEQARNRHTGFVCFINRQDAEDAMDACNDKDPFGVGRQLIMRWGKHVLKDKVGIPILRYGAFRTIISNSQTVNNKETSKLHYVDSNYSVRVVMPKDKNRFMFISVVASYVAKDGDEFEKLLLQQEVHNSNFNFLSPLFPDKSNSIDLTNDYIFYRWRVFSFCQGDGFHKWRTEPFVMFQPNGCIWYPPSMDLEAAKRETNEIKHWENTMQAFKEQRRYESTIRRLPTSHFDQAQNVRTVGSGAQLTENEMKEFTLLMKEQLCMSRDSICRGMAFCFESSIAAKQISFMVVQLLLQVVPGTSAETISARLYLISDILYNSQQPGIRNAFIYRDTIEKMSPNMFRYLGEFVRTSFGRMSQERISSVVQLIFTAWNKWGVFDPIFITELHEHFDGKEILETKTIKQQSLQNENLFDVIKSDILGIDQWPIEDEKPKGDWTDVSDTIEAAEPVLGKLLVDNSEPIETHPEIYDTDGEPLDEDDVIIANNINILMNEKKNVDSVNGVSKDDNNLDGEPLNENIDGEPLDDYNDVGTT